MGLFIEGKWSTDWHKPDAQGRFVRPDSRFHSWISADGSTGFKAEPDRYHLYVSLACPWAHRTLLMRKLKGLEDIISLSVVDPLMGEDGWRFSNCPGCLPDTVNQARYLREVYLKAKPDYSGFVTVPVLWDKTRHTIVNNESREILRMLDTEFDELGDGGADFYPEPLQKIIDRTIDAVYDPINNGVYRVGFAATQSAYEEALVELFDALDYWNEHLSRRRYLCGDVITEADWCLFPTLLRFDPVYVTHFKCNLRQIRDYPQLWNYLKELYQVPGVAQTCNLDHIKDHYYRSHRNINPGGIVPKGPVIDLTAPHDRDRPFPGQSPPKTAGRSV